MAERRPTRARSLRTEWPTQAIGSDMWWRLARKLHVRRAEVEQSLRYFNGDPHSFHPPEEPAERAAAHVLLAEQVPTYATLMYMCHGWESLPRSLRGWIISQYAEWINGTLVREAALYSLWCDFFEVPERAAFVFRRLLRHVYREHHPVVPAHSGPVPWHNKVAIYRDAALDPAMHNSLAQGLVGSFYDVFGSVRPVEARALFQSLTVIDAAVREALVRVITQPTRWHVEDRNCNGCCTSRGTDAGSRARNFAGAADRDACRSWPAHVCTCATRIEQAKIGVRTSA